MTSCPRRDWTWPSLAMSFDTWGAESLQGAYVSDTREATCAWINRPDLSLKVSFKFFTLGVAGASFFTVEEEEDAAVC